MIIYYENEEQKKSIMERHPGVAAEWIPMKGATSGFENMLPMVCVTENGQERCEIGENFIEELAKLEGGA